MRACMHRCVCVCVHECIQEFVLAYVNSMHTKSWVDIPLMFLFPIHVLAWAVTTHCNQQEHQHYIKMLLCTGECCNNISYCLPFTCLVTLFALGHWSLCTGECYNISYRLPFTCLVTLFVLGHCFFVVAVFKSGRGEVPLLLSITKRSIQKQAGSSNKPFQRKMMSISAFVH